MLPSPSQTQLPTNLTHPTAGSATPPTQVSHLSSTPQAPCCPDSISAELDQLLLEVSQYSSSNLLETRDSSSQCDRRPVILRPPPMPAEPRDPTTGQKRSKRGRPNAPRLQNGRFLSVSSPSTEKTSTETLPPPTTSEQPHEPLVMKIRASPYANLPSDMLPPDFYENSYCVISSNPLSSLPGSSQSLPSTTQSSSVSNTVVPSTLLPSSAQSTSVTTSYSESNTLVPSPQFDFPCSEQFANDIIYFVIRLAPQNTSNNLHLFVLENMVHQQFKQPLIAHINSLLAANPIRNYITYASIIQSSLSFLGII